MESRFNYGKFGSDLILPDGDYATTSPPATITTGGGPTGGTVTSSPGATGGTGGGGDCPDGTEDADGDAGGTIASPGYPDGYPADSDCSWSIVAGSGSVTITFTDMDVSKDMKSFPAVSVQEVLIKKN